MKVGRLIFGTVVCSTMMGMAGASMKQTGLVALAGGDFGVIGNAQPFTQSFRDAIHSTRVRAAGLSPAQLASATWNVLDPLNMLASGAPDIGADSFAALAPASSKVSIFSVATAASGYASSYGVSVTSVPEAESWLMLGIGFGLAGYQLHRKQKSLGQQFLNDEPAPSSA